MLALRGELEAVGKRVAGHCCRKDDLDFAGHIGVGGTRITQVEGDLVVVTDSDGRIGAAGRPRSEIPLVRIRVVAMAAVLAEGAGGQSEHRHRQVGVQLQVLVVGQGQVVGELVRDLVARGQGHACGPGSGYAIARDGGNFQIDVARRQGDGFAGVIGLVGNLIAGWAGENVHRHGGLVAKNVVFLEVLVGDARSERINRPVVLLYLGLEGNGGRGGTGTGRAIGHPLVLRSLRGAIARVDQAAHKLLWRHAIELAGQIETEMGLARGCLGGQIAIEIAQGGPGRAVGAQHFDVVRTETDRGGPLGPRRILPVDVERRDEALVKRHAVGQFVRDHHAAGTKEIRHVHLQAVFQAIARPDGAASAQGRTGTIFVDLLLDDLHGTRHERERSFVAHVDGEHILACTDQRRSCYPCPLAIGDLDRIHGDGDGGGVACAGHQNISTRLEFFGDIHRNQDGGGRADGLARGAGQHQGVVGGTVVVRGSGVQNPARRQHEVIGQHHAVGQGELEPGGVAQRGASSRGDDHLDLAHEVGPGGCLAFRRQHPGFHIECLGGDGG